LLGSFYRPALLWAAASTLAVILSLTPGKSAQAETAFDFNRKLGSGINLGNALEAPKEGDWGVVLKPEYFSLIKDAGFKHVRLPVSWSTHAGIDSPYSIEPAFLERVDWAIKQARTNGLKVVLNMHHYEELEADPVAHSQRFLAIWQQIAEHFSHQPDDLAFEIYNEPAKKIDAAKWNSLFAQALQTVRSSNPRRCVVVGPVNWNNIDQLSSLELPDDKNLLVTIHYYAPMTFTHQGASWIGPESQKWLGTKWTGSALERFEMTGNFDKAANWGHENARPIYLGEFGAYERADMDSRVRWIKAVREQAKKWGFSEAYWEFCSGFGAYDPADKSWRKPLLDALTTAP
jgi:endoglucanase